MLVPGSDVKRLQRLAEFWSWLPAFRAVGETEHLPAASKMLGVASSALCRTIHLLEEKLGHSLFDRQGRSLKLNEKGEQFLDATRNAMRIVDAGILSIQSREPAGPLHISTVGLITEVVISVVQTLHEKHPHLVCHVQHHPGHKINGLLKRGQLDAAFLHNPIAEDGLHIEKAGKVKNGIYCGRAHPLFAVEKPTLRTVLRHSFAAPVPEDAGFGADNWPP